MYKIYIHLDPVCVIVSCPLPTDFSSSCSDEKFAQSFVTKEALGFPVIFTELLLHQNFGQFSHITVIPFGYLTVCYGIDGPFIEDKHEDLPIF